MERALSCLRELALFMLAAQIIVYFLPGKKYEKYGKLIAGIVVLAKVGSLFLDVQELSWSGEENGALFPLQMPEWEKTADTALERENGRMDQNGDFQERTAKMEREEESMAERGLLQSIEQLLSRPAAQAGVSVLDVRLSGGRLVIGVGKQGDLSKEGSDSGILPVAAVRVETGEKPGEIKAPFSVTQTDTAGLRGALRKDLISAFSDALGLREGDLEVVELE